MSSYAELTNFRVHHYAKRGWRIVASQPDTMAPFLVSPAYQSKEEAAAALAGMSKRRFFVNYVSITVLSEDTPLSSDMDLRHIHEATDTGDCVGGELSVISKEISPFTAVSLLERLGSEPDFFGLTQNGGEAEDGGFQ